MRNVQKKRRKQQKQGRRENGGMQEVGILVSLCKTFWCQVIQKESGWL